MSTLIGVLKGFKEVTVTRFFGGEKLGVCVQLTSQTISGDLGYVRFTVEELKVLLPILQEHVINYSARQTLQHVEFELSSILKSEIPEVVK